MNNNQLDEAHLRQSRVRIVNHDYDFEGIIVDIFLKRNLTSVRCVVEDDRRVCLIQSAKNLELVEK